MALLPNVDAAYVEPAKIVDYLLNSGHNVGGPKSLFFESFGFSGEQPQVFEAALLVHAREKDALAQPITPHGQKFEIIGPMHCPDGRLAWVKTIWIINTGQTAPRLVTAIPA